MIKLTIINIFGESHNILDLKKGYDKTLKNIPTVMRICGGLPTRL